MVVSDDFLLSFFKEATSMLIETLEVQTAGNSIDDIDGIVGLCDCKRYILDKQREILKKQVQHAIQEDGDLTVDRISLTEAQERLGRLSSESHLPQRLKQAMDEMNEAARLALCNLVLYTEVLATTPKPSASGPENTVSQDLTRDLQSSGSFDRTKLLEYFAMCQEALKLRCVKKFMVEGGRLFENLSVMMAPQNEVALGSVMLPQSRLEYVQRLLAKSMGWNPAFVTRELQRIFVEKDSTADLVHDQEVMIHFQNLVGQMQVAIRDASLQLSSSTCETTGMSQCDPSLNDGNTRIVSVKYSEFEITTDGIEYRGVAPERLCTLDTQVSEEEQKQQIRLASEATLLEQEILMEVLNMEDEERKVWLQQAEQLSRDFLKQVMELPPGRERIDYMRSISPHTSRQLAMYKLWTSMLEANGGQLPKGA